METKMEEAKDKKNLSDSINITYSEDGVTEKTKTIKMSMGLLQAMFSKFVDKDQIFNLGMDAYLQNALINEIMDDRDENGNRKNVEKNWAMFLSCEEGEKLSNWISEHIVDFFTFKLEQQMKNVEKLMPALKEADKVNKKAMKEEKSNPA
jgi:hypothetical protein